MGWPLSRWVSSDRDAAAVFVRSAGYTDVNDADGLGRDRYPMPVGLRNNLRLSGYFALVGRHEAEQACLDTFVCSAPRTGGAANFPQSIMMVHIVSFWISYNNLLSRVSS